MNPPPLDESLVPAELRQLVPYAEIWNQSDEAELEDLIEIAPEVAKSDLTKLNRVFELDLERWLTGPEAKSPIPTREFVAFANMLMASLQL
jgi:hypothetical protein